VAAGGVTAQGVLWADARGFSTHGKVELARELVALLARRGLADVRAGVADVPIAAELAAVHGRAGGTPLTMVPAGSDRAYVGLFPLEVLHPDPRLVPLLFGIGVATCAELAALDREAVEVRLGPTAVPLWKLARADDPRLIFAPAPPEAPHASLDWVEYALKDPSRLLFVINTLIERVCTTLAADGAGARELTLEFALTTRGTHVEMIRAARPTANRRTWIRLVRARIEQVRLAAAVTGIAVHASRVAPREAPQGDLFDRGLASREATEDAVARLIEDQGDVVVTPQNTAHPLLDERTTWVPQQPAAVVREAYAAELTRERRSTVRLTTLPQAAAPRLLLQLAPVPVAITVETAPRRDHVVPVRYRDADGWHEVVNAAGPERVSGRTWDADRSYAREYFRCVRNDGVLVWLYRDARDRPAPADGARTALPRGARWFLHGWWD
jgi:protein ImuB